MTDEHRTLTFPPITLGYLFQISSSVFWLILTATGVAGYCTFHHYFSPPLMVFVFVIGGWVVSLCLHEYGHALMAYASGDHEMIDKGYLTLNPFKYTHGVWSILLPLLFLAQGGIGLPGGAIYINPAAIRTRQRLSLTSAAGPLATLLCSIALLVPFLITGEQALNEHAEFWAALAFLAALQISALLFNLLPVPGLDGFGIIAPYLPEHVEKQARKVGSYSILLLFILFLKTDAGKYFWLTIQSVISWFQVDYAFVIQGYRLFKFWL